MKKIASITGLYLLMVFGGSVTDLAQAHAGPCSDPTSQAWVDNICSRSPSNDLTCDPILNHGDFTQCAYNQSERQQEIQARQ